MFKARKRVNEIMRGCQQHAFDGPEFARQAQLAVKLAGGQALLRDFELH